MRRYLWCVALVGGAAAVAVAAPPRPAAKPDTPPAADVSAVKDKLTLWTDGKKHYLALVMTTDSDFRHYRRNARQVIPLLAPW